MKRIDNTKAKRSLISRVLPRREKQAFGAIEVYPKRVTFKTQNKGERVYILVRAHVITNLGWILRLGFMSILPLVLFIFLDYFNVDLSFMSTSDIVLLVLAYYVSVLASGLMNLLGWYYNVYLVTSERILHYVFKPLSTYKISEAEIENIQDVSQSSVGFLPNVFGFGDILVQTAATRNKFYFRAVPRPVWFRDVIADLANLTRTNEP